MWESQRSSLRLVMSTFVFPPRSFWSRHRSVRRSSSGSIACTDVPSIPAALSKLSHTTTNGCSLSERASLSSFCSVGSAPKPVPKRAIPIWFSTDSALRRSLKANQNGGCGSPPVSRSHARKPRASVVFPTPPRPWTRIPAGLFRIARSKASTARSRPIKP